MYAVFDKRTGKQVTEPVSKHDVYFMLKHIFVRDAHHYEVRKV